MTAPHDHQDSEAALYGIMAEYDDPDAVLKAAETVYEAGYRRLDAYTPFPVHGLAEAIGFRKTWLSTIVLIGGVSGAIGGFGMQVFARVIHYPYYIGGREQLSWPAFIPITFELGILCAAFAAVIGMLALNGLPRPHNPVFNAKGFERASQDRFFLCVEAEDEKFDVAKTTALLKKTGSVDVQEVRA